MEYQYIIADYAIKSPDNYVGGRFLPILGQENNALSGDPDWGFHALVPAMTPWGEPAIQYGKPKVDRRTVWISASSNMDHVKFTVSLVESIQTGGGAGYLSSDERTFYPASAPEFRYERGDVLVEVELPLREADRPVIFNRSEVKKRFWGGYPNRYILAANGKEHMEGFAVWCEGLCRWIPSEISRWPHPQPSEIALSDEQLRMAALQGIQF